MEQRRKIATPRNTNDPTNNEFERTMRFGAVDFPSSKSHIPFVLTTNQQINRSRHSNHGGDNDDDDGVAMQEKQCGLNRKKIGHGPF
mmetsp:Transcript_21768/g.60505  ORF Transcript_21768/g.60505 Transcript_21768/m.60505 type:complete len:87 (+) Transcript_21768:67-327(+)